MPTRTTQNKNPVLSSKSFEGGESVGGMTGSLRVKASGSNKDGLVPGKFYQLKPSILSIEYLKSSQQEKWTQEQIRSVQDGLPENIFSDENIQKEFDKEQRSKKLQPRKLTENEVIKRRKEKTKETSKAYKTARVRRFKAWGTDKELFGETIASIVSESITNSDKEGYTRLVPKVSLVYDEDEKSLKIASKYLDNVQGTLDDYALKQDGVSQGEEKHISISMDPKGLKSGPGIFNVSDKTQLKEDLADAIALSIISGDNDVNPGNMLVIKDSKGDDRIARIDFGHAFNNMIDHSFSNVTGSRFGAGLYNPDHRILDFLNRKEIVHLSSREPKLWRDFIGVVPSRELAEAFRKISESENIGEGLERAKIHFEELTTKLKKNESANRDLIMHVKNSLIYMNQVCGYDTISSDLSIEGVVQRTFKNLDKFYKKGQSQMKEAAELMDMQCDIDEMIEKELKGEEIGEIRTKINNNYLRIKQYEGIKVKGSVTSISWIRNDRVKDRFEGSLDSFIQHRKEEILTARAIKDAKILNENGIMLLDNRGILGKKEGGVNDAGKFGGHYEIDGKRNLVKREKDDSKNMAEFMGSVLFQDLSPGYGAKVRLAKFKNDDEVYVASEFFNDYKDLYVDAHENLGKKVPKDRPRMVGTWNKRLFRAGLSRGNYTGFAATMPTSLLIGDFDTHWGNVGAVGKDGERKKLVRIDFAAAFNNLEDEIHPHSISRHPVGFGPTNHFREYPLAMKLDPQFIEELKRVSASDIRGGMEKGIAELRKYYPDNKIVEFGKKAGIKDAKTVEDVESGLITRLENRQKSLKNLATELEIDKCLKKIKGKWTLIGYPDSKDNMKNFEQVVRDNPEYFRDAVHGKKIIHFRDPYHKNTWCKWSRTSRLSKFVREEAEKILNKMEAEKELNVVSPISIERTIPDSTIIKVPEGGEKSLISPKTKMIDPLRSLTEVTGSPSSADIAPAIKEKKLDIIDPIPVDSSKPISISDKFIELGKDDQENDKVMSAYKKLVLIKKLNAGIKKEEDVVKLTDLKKEQALQDTLYKFEAELYKEIDEKFRDKFQEINWQKKGAEIREINIADDVVFQETSKEVKIGSKQMIARTINFTDKINSGPLHLSIALKDEDGKNMPKDSAVYFTVHYNNKGELEEMTYPISIEFDSNTKQGFIEKNGKIYTLPIDKDSFDKMNSKIRENKFKKDVALDRDKKTDRAIIGRN